MGTNDTHDNGMHVALVSCSGILGDLLRSGVATVADIAVTADLHCDDVGQLADALRAAHPDAVVWVLDDDAPIADHAELFNAERGWPVIAVLDDGRRIACWQLQPHRTTLIPPSFDRLVDALRDAAVPQ